MAEFTSSGRTSLWYHWWPQSGTLKLKVSQHRSGKDSSTVKDITENKSSHCKGDRLQREPSHFSSLSIFPIHPDAQSPHLDTSINSSLSPQVPHSIPHLAPLPYLPQIQPSHHFHCRHLSLSHQQSREGTTAREREHCIWRTEDHQCGFSCKGRRGCGVGQN